MATTPALRVKGHRVTTIATRGGLIAECSCGETLSPKGTGQTGRNVDLGLFSGYSPAKTREFVRTAHEAHKAAVVAAQ